MDKYNFNVSEKRSRWQLQSLWWSQKVFCLWKYHTPHHKAEEIRVSLRIGRKTLKPGAISKIKPRKSPKKRCLPATNESTSTDSYLEEERETNNSNNLLPITYPETNLDRTKLLEKEADNLKEKINFLVAESNALKAENDTQMTRWKWHADFSTGAFL